MGGLGAAHGCCTSHCGVLEVLTKADAIFDWIGQKISGTSSSVNYTPFTLMTDGGYVEETDENGNTVPCKIL